MDIHSLFDYVSDPRSLDREERTDTRKDGDAKRETYPLESITRFVTPPKRGVPPKRDPDGERAKSGGARRRTLRPSLELKHERSIAPRRKNRDRESALGLQLRPEEWQLLLEVGKFRVISAADLEREIYKGNAGQFRHDVQFLKEQGLIGRHFLNLRRDGKGDRIRRFEAVTLTKNAQKLLISSGHAHENQELYAGLVKPREAEHDAQIYRAYLKEAADIGGRGGKNIRVQLDFELKAKVNRAVHEARKADRTRDQLDIKQEVAEQFGLKVHHNRIVVPDARLDYDLPNGGGSAQVDLEVATSAYRHCHIAAKAQAGFKIYISRGDIGRLGAGVVDDHDLMSEILDF